jgi:hypothetical protein
MAEDDRANSLDECLKGLAKYELANKVPYLPLQLLNNLKGRDREEFAYLLDKFCCEYIDDRKITLKVADKKECVEQFTNHDNIQKLIKTLPKYFSMLKQLLQLYANVTLKSDTIGEKPFADMINRVTWSSVRRLIVENISECDPFAKGACELIDTITKIEEDIYPLQWNCFKFYLSQDGKMMTGHFNGYQNTFFENFKYVPFIKFLSDTEFTYTYDDST